MAAVRWCSCWRRKCLHCRWQRGEPACMLLPPALARLGGMMEGDWRASRALRSKKICAGRIPRRPYEVLHISQRRRGAAKNCSRSRRSDVPYATVAGISLALRKGSSGTPAPCPHSHSWSELHAGQTHSSFPIRPPRRLTTCPRCSQVIARQTAHGMSHLWPGLVRAERCRVRACDANAVSGAPLRRF